MPADHLRPRLDALASLSPEEAFNDAGYLLFELLRALTETEPVAFPNHYTRLVFLERNDLVHPDTARTARWLSLQWREWKTDPTAFTPTPRLIDRATTCLHNLLTPQASPLTQEDLPTPNTQTLPGDVLRCVFVAHDTIDGTDVLVCSAEETGTLHLVLPDFLQYLKPLVWPWVRLNLIRARHLGGQRFTVAPDGFAVLEPDLLINASTLARLAADGPQPRLHLFNLLHATGKKDAFFKGDVLNRIFDQLLAGIPPDPDEMARQTLAEQPEYSLLFTAKGYETAVENIHAQTANLDHAHLHALAHSSTVHVEATLLAPDLGLTGRLDALDVPPAERPTIVELKSSRLPTTRNLHEADEFQSIAYSLMIQRTAPGPARSVNILYSATTAEDAPSPLRAAAVDHRQQALVLQLRNQVVFLQHRLAEAPRKLLDTFDPERCGHDSFNKYALYDLREDWKDAPPFVRAYVAEFAGFLAREERLAWLGTPGQHGSAGLARVWNQLPATLQQSGRLLTGLRLTAPDEEQALLFILPSSRTDDAFLPGSRALLFPGDLPGATPLHQVNILDRDANTLTLQPRHRIATDALAADTTWSLVRDVTTYGFKSQLAGLRHLLNPSPARDRFLGLLAPRPPIPLKVSDPLLTPRQCEIASLAIGAPNYFLIQGPPGTGKTRHVLRALVQTLLTESDPTAPERVLCLAYTNRAVHEIARTLAAAGTDFLLLGHNLPDDLLPHAPATRATGKSIEQTKIELHRPRVLLATTSTWNSSGAAYQALGFTTAVIDEASQLLEPHVAGILSTIPRFILIGDHNQLPAVVGQSADACAVRDPDLNGHIHSLTESVFARLWRTAQTQDWPVTAQLTEQGRMHETIMAFPSQQFYDDSLVTMHPDQRASGPIRPSLADKPDALDESLLSHRVLFIDTPAVTERHTHPTEARWVALLTERLLRDGVPPEEIGVICPYRRQIQAVRAKLPPELARSLTIDTVERFQGSTRDVIIVSFTACDPTQLDHLESLDPTGTIDRKLNVALSRARHQLILLGHRPTLKTGTIYPDLFEWLDQNARVANHFDLWPSDRPDIS